MVLGGTFYLATYLLRPARIFRSAGNIFFRKGSVTLFEERLGEAFQRNRRGGRLFAKV
jgi:hypothetical protein